MQNHKDIMLAMGFIMPILASIAVGARFTARAIKHAKLGLDDYTILLALICDIGLSIALLVGTFVGQIGVWDQSVIGKEESKVLNITIWISQWFVVLTPGFTKISIILLYNRIFQPHRVGKTLLSVFIWTFMAISVIWTISFFFANLLSCLPVSANWAPKGSDKTASAQCVNIINLWMAQGISDTITDAFILTLPIAPVLGLQLPLAKKTTVMGIFLLGAFTVVSGILRCVYLWDATHFKSKHVIYNEAPGLYWGLIQSGVAIISSCLPCLSPIFSTASVQSLIKSAQHTWTRLGSGGSSKEYDSAGYSSQRTGSRPNVWRTKRLGSGSGDSSANLARSGGSVGDAEKGGVERVYEMGSVSSPA